MKRKKNKKNSKGVTLVGLIITIIIMLILLTATVAVVINGNLFDRAAEAGLKYKIQGVGERLEIAKGTSRIKDKGDLKKQTYFDTIEEEGIIKKMKKQLN